jgi:hypothetical protein
MLLHLDLKGAALKSAWISWVISDDGNNARSTRGFLNTCFENVPLGKRKSFLKKLETGDRRQIEATAYELVAHELLRRLHLSPELEPSIGRKRPDLSFKVAGKEFIADVFVTHSPA